MKMTTTKPDEKFNPFTLALTFESDQDIYFFRLLLATAKDKLRSPGYAPETTEVLYDMIDEIDNLIQEAR